MATISMPYTFTPGTTILSTQVNANFAAIVTLVNGQIDNSNISTTANIAISKLGLNPGGAAFDKTTTGNQTWGSGLTTDTVPQVVMFSDKGLQFGPGGAAALDVRLKRSAAVTLRLDKPDGTPAILDLASGAILDPNTITMDGNTSVLDMAGGSIINVGALAGPNPANAAINGFRVSISNTLPVSGNGTATSLNLVPYTSSMIGLYNGTGWTLFNIATILNVALPSSTATGYDVYVDYNAGVPALGVVVWPGINTPPARGTQDGVPYTNGAARYRLVAAVQTNAVAGQTSHLPGERLLDNVYNQVPLSLFAQIPAASWQYNVNTVRASDANTTNGQGRVAIFKAFPNASVCVRFIQPFALVGAASATVSTAQNSIGLDSTTAPSSPVSSTNTAVTGATQSPGGVNVAELAASGLTAGAHYFQMLESADATPRNWTFYGNGVPGNSLAGTILG